MVMIAMGLFYAIGLWLVGLEVGILIGLLAGLLTFVPYVGPTTVLVGGVVAALVQFGDWQHLAGVLAVWGIGQLLESYVLTPKLVGDRVGLSPVTVVFAVMTGGSLFGFLGMLLALPVASVANVLIRHVMQQYTASRFYLGEAEACAVEGVDARTKENVLENSELQSGMREETSAGTASATGIEAAEQTPPPADRA
jgi:predicted PurR-regulated permease PerM